MIGRSKVTSRYRVTIIKAARDISGIKMGDKLSASVDNDGVIVLKKVTGEAIISRNFFNRRHSFAANAC